MNEEIRTLEKVIEQLKRRVTAAARESFNLNGRVVQIDILFGNKLIEVHVDGDYVGGMGVGGEYADAVNLARDIAKACYVDLENYATAIDELMYRLDRAED